MPIRKIAGIPRPEDSLCVTEGPGQRSALRADDLRCSFTSLSGGGGVSALVTTSAPVCDRLRLLFGGVADEPVPDLLTSLAERLDKALASGELVQGKGKTSGR